VPTYDQTTKYSLRKLQGSNAVSDVDAGIAALADDVDAIMATDSQGLAANRPTSTPGSPGKSGRWYKTTDGGLLYRDHGTGYDEIPLVPIGESKLGTGSAGLAKGSFSAYRNASLSVFSGIAIVADTEEWDVSGWYNPTNGRFTPQVAGYYRLTGRVESNGGFSSGVFFAPAIYKNGSLEKYLSYEYGRGGAISASSEGSLLVKANGSTDYFNLVLDHGSGGAVALLTGAQYLFFQGELVGRS
jgi:hypothetical protein